MKLRKLLTKINPNAMIRIVVPSMIYPSDYSLFDKCREGMCYSGTVSSIKETLDSEDILDMKLDQLDSGRYDIIIIYLKK